MLRSLMSVVSVRGEGFQVCCPSVETFPLPVCLLCPLGAPWARGCQSVCALFGFEKVLGWKQLDCFIGPVHSALCGASLGTGARWVLPLPSFPSPARQGEVMDTPPLVFWGIMPDTGLAQALWFTCICLSPRRSCPSSTGPPLFGSQLFSH